MREDYAWTIAALIPEVNAVNILKVILDIDSSNNNVRKEIRYYFLTSMITFCNRDNFYLFNIFSN